MEDLRTRATEEQRNMQSRNFFFSQVWEGCSKMKCPLHELREGCAYLRCPRATLSKRWTANLNISALVA